MTIKDGIKFGIGYTIGSALVGATAKILLEHLENQLKKLEESKQTENKDAEEE